MNFRTKFIIVVSFNAIVFGASVASLVLYFRDEMPIVIGLPIGSALALSIKEIIIWIKLNHEQAHPNHPS